jgi:hypothetical protein
MSAGRRSPKRRGNRNETLAFRPAPFQWPGAPDKPRPGRLAGLAPAAVMQANGMAPGDAAFKEIVAARALTVLRRLAKRGTAARHKPRH